MYSQIAKLQYCLLHINDDTIKYYEFVYALLEFLVEGLVSYTISKYVYITLVSAFFSILFLHFF